MDKLGGEEMSGAMMKQRAKKLVLFSALIFLACGIWSESKAQGRMSNTVAFSQLPISPIPQMLQVAGVTLLANCSGQDFPRIFDHGQPNGRGYNFPDCGVTVVLPIVAKAIELRVCQFAGEITIEALDSAGNSISRQTVGYQRQCGEISIKDDRISTIRLVAGNNEASIVWIKYS